MLFTIDPNVNDSLTADYKFHWINPDSCKKENCTIFTYGQGRDVAIAIFNLIYPDCQIANIEELCRKEIVTGE